MGRELIYRWPLSRRGGLFSLSLARVGAYPALAILSNSYSRPIGRLFTCYSPVRRSFPKKRARLACVRHAASVHSEPGSNSPIKLKYFLHIRRCVIFCLNLILESQDNIKMILSDKLFLGFFIGPSLASIILLFSFQRSNALSTGDSF